MATVIDTPNSTTVERTVVERSDSSGWAVAVVILIAVVAVGGFLWMRYYQPAASQPAPATSNGGANINVTLPASDSGNGSTNGNASGAAGSPDTSNPNPAQ